MLSLNFNRPSGRVQTRDNFEVLKIKECGRAVVATIQSFGFVSWRTTQQWNEVFATGSKAFVIVA